PIPELPGAAVADDLLSGGVEVLQRCPGDIKIVARDNLAVSVGHIAQQGHVAAGKNPAWQGGDDMRAAGGGGVVVIGVILEIGGDIAAFIKERLFLDIVVM